MNLRNTSAIGKTGFKFENVDFAKSAAIATSKLGTRTLNIPLPAVDGHISGAGTSFQVDGIHITVTMPDANASTLYFSVALPAESIGSTPQMSIDIYWKTTVITGNVEFAVAVATKEVPEAITADATFTDTDAAATVASVVKKTTITFTGLTHTAADFLGIAITRDGTDAQDTLGADIDVLGAVLNFPGRG